MLNEKEKELKEAAVRKGPADKPFEVTAVGQANKIVSKESENKSVKAADKTEKTRTVADKKTQAVKPEAESRKHKEGSANEMIIQMYKKGKSVLDISKELGIGQGEVKLMISLYGGNK